MAIARGNKKGTLQVPFLRRNSGLFCAQNCETFLEAVNTTTYV